MVLLAIFILSGWLVVAVPSHLAPRSTSIQPEITTVGPQPCIAASIAAAVPHKTIALTIKCIADSLTTTKLVALCAALLLQHLYCSCTTIQPANIALDQRLVSKFRIKRYVGYVGPCRSAESAVCAARVVRYAYVSE